MAMARKYSKKSQKDVKEAMHEYKEGKLKSGKSGKKVTSRKQAVAIGLSKARKHGAKVPSKKSSHQPLNCKHSNDEARHFDQWVSLDRLKLYRP